MSSTPITLESHLKTEFDAGRLDSPLTTLLLALAEECTVISDCVHGGALAGVLGSAESENVQGETQKKLDLIANDKLETRLAHSGVVAGVASEELDHCSPVAEAAHLPYLVLFDPLDGSSNIDVNVSIGTIFSVLENPKAGSTDSAIGDEDFLQPGNQQVAAGYVVYGPQTTLVLTVGNGVHVFTLDRQRNTFFQTQTNLEVPKQSHEFAINMSNMRHWLPPVQRYINELLAGTTGPRGKNYNMRWIASMVADVHRVLSRGGTFMYPQDQRDPSKPGKLRLMYEANPMSLLMEQAGGKAYAGADRILDIEPTQLHQRCSVLMGSSQEIELLVGYHQG